MDLPERIANLFMAVVFLFSAAVQYNDPDPFVWAPLYLAAAAACFLALAGRLQLWLPLLLGLVCLPWAGVLAFRVLGKQSILESEEGREMLGLLLVAVWMAYLVGRDWRRARAALSN